ncbi:MAG: EamA family transporter [Thermoanaerobaculia bacterium]
MSAFSPRLKQVLAFAAVYLIWGSTFLAIRVALETLPGFAMAGMRFLVVAGILFTWAWARGDGWPSLAEWRSSALVGILLVAVGNGAVVWAEQHVASGVVALIVATEPLWVMLMLWLLGRGDRPSGLSLVGVLLGFAGAAVLALHRSADGSTLHLPSLLVVVAGSLSWAAGSLAARSSRLPRSLPLSSGMQMLCGGIALSVMGLATGDWSRFSLAAVSLRSLLALGFLIFFGALVAFLAYNFLVRTTAPTLVATYAFVNPMVAVFLGWWLLDEPVERATLIATGLIVVSVVLVSLATLNRVRESAS